MVDPADGEDVEFRVRVPFGLHWGLRLAQAALADGAMEVGRQGPITDSAAAGADFTGGLLPDDAVALLRCEARLPAGIAAGTDAAIEETAPEGRPDATTVTRLFFAGGKFRLTAACRPAA